MFEIQMTMEMVAYLVYLTRLFRYTFIHITAHDKYISSLIDWIHVYLLVLFFVARLFSLNYICESVSAKSNEMNKMIHRLTHSLRYADIRDEIFQFTLQIIHRPLKLSALGLFNFGNDFLRKFIITIVTFVTIVIQMPGASKAFMGF
ncbi:PREDICTED: uncharacterized protein LOC105462194 [Wasmannia auropunctata]|uniref:uncharacterized protein LOC105462194 n=1 Tax=Wasmannia auropunctata TaxID=64793 RepID=UPI0005F02BB2|nr:PREDICTED: uncharacterized protein LOC105462194 [Wasmannia auropunctata]